MIVTVEEAVAGEICINAIERQVEHKEIELRAGRWKIEHNDQNIDIPEEIELKKDGVLEFSYSSLKTGIFKHSHIIVRNDDLGHLKFMLNIRISEQPETVLDYGKVMLGKESERVIYLVNPDNYQMTIEGICSNQNAFFYKQCPDSTGEPVPEEPTIRPISK